MDTLPNRMEHQELVIKEDSELKAKLKQEPQVLKLAASIDVSDQAKLLEFGREPANGISAFTGKLMEAAKTNSIKESNELLNQLSETMEKFDRKDFSEKKGLMDKIFNRGNKMIEKLFNKYQSMGPEIDKVYIKITKYESEMKKSTAVLEELYEQNFNHFIELEKYIAAGEVRIEELKAEEPVMRMKAETGDQTAIMQLTSLQEAIELLEQRVHELETAKQVSYEAAPQIRMLQQGNTKLTGKINSAFVTAIPLFKTGLIDAIAAKRQNLAAHSENGLDRGTSELPNKNADDMSEQQSIQIETVEQTWKTIMQGINDTREIEQENRRMREEGLARIKELQERYEETPRKAQ